MAERRSYQLLAAKPAWALVAGAELIATVRADKAEEARDLFKRFGITVEGPARVVKISERERALCDEEDSCDRRR